MLSKTIGTWMCLGALAGLVFYQSPASDATSPAPARQADSPESPFDAERAYEYLQQICELGPRPSGSKAMQAQQELLEKHFEKLGGKVSFQRFRTRHPLDGSLVPMANLLVEWHPERKERVLLAAHYDTRPLPDRDPDPRKRRNGQFVGANDGASGVALLMELAHHIAELPTSVGVDFVLFDGEELIFDNQRDHYFLGSEWFSRNYVGKPPEHKYRWAVLVDMIGDKNLEIFQERNSMSWQETAPLVVDLWKTAAKLGIREFVPRRKHTVNDDHVKLRNIGKIPTCVIIDFDYPAWHTTADVPHQCSGESLAKVAQVLMAWLPTVAEGEPGT